MTVCGKGPKMVYHACLVNGQKDIPRYPWVEGSPCSDCPTGYNYCPEGLCSQTPPTGSPTKSPVTSKPTRSPTKYPTRRPTKVPTPKPTK